MSKDKSKDVSGYVEKKEKVLRSRGFSLTGPTLIVVFAYWFMNGNPTQQVNHSAVLFIPSKIPRLKIVHAPRFQSCSKCAEMVWQGVRMSISSTRCTLV